MPSEDGGEGPGAWPPPAWPPPAPPPPPPPPVPGFGRPDLPPVPIGVPARTSPLTIALELSGLFLLAAVVGLPVLLGGSLNPIELFAAVFVGGRVVGWAFRTYELTDSQIVLREGVLQRRHRVVPFSRIQQVDLREQVIPRILGLVEVHVETAADAGSTAVSLRYLERRRAEALREHLLREHRRLRAPTGPGEPVASTATPRVLMRLDGADLLLAGATGPGVAFVVAVGLVPAAIVAASVASSGGDGPFGAVLRFVLISAGGAAAVAAVSAIASLISRWGYALSLVGDDLHVSHGLLDHREVTVPRSRLQQVRIAQSPIQRASGHAAVALHSAATPGGDGAQGHIELPWCRLAEVGDLLEQVMASPAWRPPPLAARPPAARRRAVVRRLALTASAVGALAALTWPAGGGLLPLAVVGVPWGLAAHRLAGSHLAGPVLATASGVVVRELVLVPTARVQSARTACSPLQRRAGLATVRFDVAGSSRWTPAPGLGDLGAAVAAGARRVAVAAREADET